MQRRAVAPGKGVDPLAGLGHSWLCNRRVLSRWAARLSRVSLPFVSTRRTDQVRSGMLDGLRTACAKSAGSRLESTWSEVIVPCDVRDARIDSKIDVAHAQ